MQARRTLIPDQKGTKTFLDHYGEQLVCVHYGWVKQADGKWDSTKRVWEIHHDQAVPVVQVVLVANGKRV